MITAMVMIMSTIMIIVIMNMIPIENNSDNGIMTM
jgi:hypothetical protein